jgi:hypothetical protein
VRYRRLEWMSHVAHMHAGLMAAATMAVRELGQFLREASTGTGPATSTT